jgi:pimeloyl-ACP methyl ester carboxylesterase
MSNVITETEIEREEYQESGERQAIDQLEAIQVGESAQWIRIKGADVTNPVLLLIQQGPGLPMINEVRRFEQVLGLEKDFTVVYWDQRGTGRSVRGHAVENGLDLMVGDAVTVLEYLRDRFGTAAFVAGFSLGATVGVMAAAHRPDLVATLVAVGMDLDGVAAGNEAYKFALATARQHGNRRAIRQLEAIGPPPHTNVKQFATRVRWATNFGGVSSTETYGSLVRGLLASLLRSPDYSKADVIRTVRGITATQAALLPELGDLDLVRTLPRLEVPIVMVQGRLDRVAPGEVAQRYVDILEAPSKELVWFENSAHTPHLEEPEKFRDLLMQIRSHQSTGEGKVMLTNSATGVQS